MIRELVPNFDGLFNALRELILHYQGEMGYIPTTDESLDVIYAIDYLGWQGEARERKVAGVSVRSNDIYIATIDWPYKLEGLDEDFFKDDGNWSSLRYSGFAYIHTLVNMAEYIEEYLDPAAAPEVAAFQEFFPVTSVSRDDLDAKGFDVTAVSDEAMRRLAGRMAEDYLEQMFWISMETLASLEGIPRKPEIEDFFLIDEETRKDTPDSLLLESGQEILSGKVEGRTVAVVVCGDVRIVWKGESYRNRGCFPDDLVQAIRNGSYRDSDDCYIDMNNWYEIRVWEDDSLLHEGLLDISLPCFSEKEARNTILQFARETYN